MFSIGDFYGHSQLWWQCGDSTPEDNLIEDLTTMLGITELIDEPNKYPSCIIFTDQPHLVLESGTYTSFDPYCHCRFNFKIPPPPPPFERTLQ